MDGVRYTLEFEKSAFKRFFFMPKFKISFTSNQGRCIDLLWNQSYFSSSIYYKFVIEEVIEFIWKEGSQKVSYKYLKNGTNDLVQYWILHTFLPLYYILEDMYEMLHVGAVAIDDKVCLFAAPSFGGKSTLTHHFLEKGHTLFSDDKLACFKKNDRYYAVPSYPYARNYRKLEDLGQYVENFANRAMPIACMYRLKQVGKDAAVDIREIRGYDKFAIIEMSSEMKLSFLKEKKFLKLNDLAKTIKIYEVTVPQSLDRLEEVYEKLVVHGRKHGEQE